MTPKQEEALRDYLQEVIVPLIEEVLVKKLGQAMTFAKTELPKREWQGLTEDERDAMLAQQALDKKAENARELGLDYESVQDSGIVTAGGFGPRTQRTWVGLTDEEREAIAVKCGAMSADWLVFIKAVERNLKEKNT